MRGTEGERGGGKEEGGRMGTRIIYERGMKEEQKCMLKFMLRTVIIIDTEIHYLILSVIKTISMI